MKNNLHLWITLSACLSIVSLGIHLMNKNDKLEKFAQPNMGLAWYEFGKKVNIGEAAGLPPTFVVRTQEAGKARGFVSEKEWSSRQDAKRLRYLDDAYLAELHEFDAVKFKKKFSSSGRIAWMMNNGEKPVHLQTYHSPIMIREAKDMHGQWRPIEYFTLGYGEPAYSVSIIHPGEALPFHYQPTEGDFKTKIRFKFLGLDQFYYSDSFTGFIDYGAFEEKRESRYHYRLEAFKRFSPRYLSWAY